jgi:hypothetical protein
LREREHGVCSHSDDTWEADVDFQLRLESRRSNACICLNSSLPSPSPYAGDIAAKKSASFTFPCFVESTSLIICSTSLISYSSPIEAKAD